MQKIFLLILQTWIIKKVRARNLWYKKGLAILNINYSTKDKCACIALIRKAKNE